MLRNLVARALAIGIALSLKALENLGMDLLQHQRILLNVLDKGNEVFSEHFA